MKNKKDRTRRVEQEEEQNKKKTRTRRVEQEEDQNKKSMSFMS